MKKLLSFVALLMVSLTTAWAQTIGTETSGNQGSSNTSIVGTSYSLDGKFIAGKGGVMQGNMPDKGVKLRSNQGDLVFTVNAGYEIKGFRFYGCGNTTTAVTITSVTVDGGENLISANIELPAKGASNSGDILLSGISAKDNITLTFAEGSSAQIVGTWEIDYVQNEVIVQEINSVTLNGTAISDTDLAKLKETKTLTLDGSDLNGLGAVDVSLSSGGTNVTRYIADGIATYSFKINGTDEYTVKVENFQKSYTGGEGAFAYFKKGDSEADGANTNSVNCDGVLTLKMEDESKAFQSGAGSLTIRDATFVPLKLSTGSAVNMTFPDKYVATKLIVYGWSQNGNGFLTQIKETADAEDKVIEDTRNNVFYATNTSSDLYPSNYEYELDNWESIYFTASGSSSQPFVVMEVVLTEKTAPADSAAVTFDTSLTDGSKYYATFSADQALDFTNVEGVKAYVVTSYTYDVSDLTFYANVQEVAKAPANTGVLLVGDKATTYTIPFTDETVELEAENKLLVLEKDTPARNLQNPYTLVYDKLTNSAMFQEFSFGNLSAGSVYLSLTDDEDDEAWGYIVLKFASDGPDEPGEVVAKANIGELNAVEASGNYEVSLSNAVITYVADDNFVLEDATGALNVSLENVGTSGLKAGYLLNGKLTFAAEVADYSLYGMGITRGFTLTSDSQMDLGYALWGMGVNVEITEGEAPQPLVINEETDFSDLITWAADPYWRYVKFTDATVKIKEGAYTDDYLITLDDEEYYALNSLFGAVSIDDIQNLKDGDIVETAGFVYSSYGFNYFEPISLTVKPAEPSTVAVTVGSDGYATFSCDKALDFTDSGIKAYVAVLDGMNITFSEVQQVPANIGVLLYAEGGATKDINIANGGAQGAMQNNLVASNADMEGADLEGCYILSKVNGQIGFYKASSKATLAAGKAYFPAAVDGARIILPGQEATSIRSIETAEKDTEIYNLQGQRVNKAAKGLNIINGRKVIIR